MFVTVLGRHAGVTPDDGSRTPFADVPENSYYSGYLNWASENRIVLGTSIDQFSPNDLVTREQMITMIHRYLSHRNVTLSNVLEEIQTFSDTALIAPYAKQAVETLQGGGIILGKENNRFDPQGTATRAEVATILQRLDRAMES